MSLMSPLRRWWNGVKKRREERWRRKNSVVSLGHGYYPPPTDWRSSVNRSRQELVR